MDPKTLRLLVPGLILLIIMAVIVVLVLRKHSNNPLACSGNGTMNSDGSCQCSMGFYGKDCSLPLLGTPFYMIVPSQTPDKRYVMYNSAGSQLGAGGLGIMPPIFLEQSPKSNNLVIGFMQAGTKRYWASTVTKGYSPISGLFSYSVTDPGKAIEFAFIPVQTGGYYVQYLGTDLKNLYLGNAGGGTNFDFGVYNSPTDRYVIDFVPACP